MKRLLYITFIISSIHTFAQEKGPICSISCSLTHPNSSGLDYFGLHSFSLNQEMYNGAFHLDSLDSTVMEISLPIGDSLVYHGGWVDWGPCETPEEVEDVDGVLTILEGDLFPITAVKSISSSPDWDYSISQDAVIRSSCLLEIKAVYAANPRSHFIRVQFVDPDSPDLGVPELSKDIYIVLKDNQNTLFIQADENAILNAAIYSLAGQLVLNTTIEGQQNLDISSFPKGYYIILVKDSNGAEKQLKFIR